MGVWLLCSLSLAGPPLSDENVQNGWVVEIEEKSRAHPRLGKDVFYQALLRKAPGKIGPTVLFEQNLGGMKFRHRGDGTIIAMGSSPPRVMAFFPESDTPFDIKTKDGQSKLDLSRDWHHVHFVDDYLLYSQSYANERRWTLGLVQLDVAKQTVSKHTILVETNHAKLNMAELGMPIRSVVKVGEYLFWTNFGLNDGSDDPKPENDWGHRKLRIIRLTDHALITPDKIPADAIRPHKELLLSTVESKAHNVWPEFEIWAIGWLGQHHRTDDVMKRLTALSKTIVEKTEGYVEIQYGRFSTAVPALTKAYRDALTDRGP